MRDRFVCTRDSEVKFLEVRYGEKAGVYANDRLLTHAPLDLLADEFGVVAVADFIRTATPSYAQSLKPATPTPPTMGDGVGMELGTHWNEIADMQPDGSGE